MTGPRDQEPPLQQMMIAETHTGGTIDAASSDRGGCDGGGGFSSERRKSKASSSFDTANQNIINNKVTTVASDGVVTLKLDNGTIYTGQVVRHGFGTEVDRSGNKYEGQWH